MKNKEYKEITNSNKSYLKDFLSVLEEDEDSSPVQISKFTESTNLKKLAGSDTSIEVGCKTFDLQMKAQEAIKNSMKVMQKFKSILQEN